MAEARTPTPLLTERYVRALGLTEAIHRHQLRKGTDTPYLAHLLAVSALVLEAGGDEDCAIAALLHDAIEDSDDGAATAARVRAQFGDRVARIVEACSDSIAVPGKAKPDWRTRKTAYLQHLESAPREVMLVSAADKLHNARALLMDYRRHGDALWQRFSAPWPAQRWYYRSLADVFSRRLPGPLAAELQRTVRTLEAMVAGADIAL